MRRLQEAPQEFSFFQAVQLLERALPGSAPLGGPGPAARERVRLRPETSLAFQAAEVTEVTPPSAEQTHYRLTTTVAGLYGANSPLPGFYSEEILHSEVDTSQDPVRAFLDVINHRLLSLLYRAWLKYRWGLTFRRDARDSLSVCMLHLAGLGSPGVRDTLELPAQRLLRYAGFLTQIPRNASTLAGVVADYFDDIPVVVFPCEERWVVIDPADRTRLGEQGSVLGESFTLGERVCDRTGKFVLQLDSFDELADFADFLPLGRHHQELGALVRFLVPDPLQYDVRLGLAGQAVPTLRLGGADGAGRLGWTSWLGSEGTPADVWEIFPAPQAEPVHELRGVRT